jgi:ubiquinone/menaquinone biosynthesis C-methylase UbiE
MKGNYDYVAPFYDALSGLVFGDAIKESQRFLIKQIPPHTTILIVGGGTGLILEEISRLHYGSFEIVYVDSSRKMIELSKKRNIMSNRIAFVHHSIVDACFTQKFDVVITPFLLDNFCNVTVNLVFDKIDNALRPGGLWLFADFSESQNKPVWQELLLKSMYLFFKSCCNIEASHLPKMQRLFESYRYEVLSSQLFFKKFIWSIVFKKQ